VNSTYREADTGHSPAALRTMSHSRHLKAPPSASSKFPSLGLPTMTQMLFTRRNSGYTMMELVMVVSLVGILAAIAIPGFRYVTVSNRIAGEVNGLLGDLQFARSEAVKEGQTVTVCSSANGTSCAGSPNWQIGWIVFLDTNGDKQVQAGEAVVRVQPAFSSTDTFVAGSALNAVTFNRLGYAPTGSPTPININLHDSTNNTNWTRCLAINPIGSAVTEKVGVGTPPCA
jgi:type IV fimbrial biogenesis protein FimT